MTRYKAFAVQVTDPKSKSWRTCGWAVYRLPLTYAPTPVAAYSGWSARLRAQIRAAALSRWLRR